MHRIASTLLAASLFAGSLAGCAVPAEEAPEQEHVGVADDELRTGIILWFIEYDAGAGAFDVGVEITDDVLADRNARYLVAQLFYTPPGDAGVSPFSATPMDDVDWVAVGRGKYRGVVRVEGPRPSNIDDVVARLSANPRPHP